MADIPQPPGFKAFKYGSWIVIAVLIVTMIRVWLIIFNVIPLEVHVK